MNLASDLFFHLSQNGKLKPANIHMKQDVKVLTQATLTIQLSLKYSPKG